MKIKPINQNKLLSKKKNNKNIQNILGNCTPNLVVTKLTQYNWSAWIKTNNDMNWYRLLYV